MAPKRRQQSASIPSAPSAGLSFQSDAADTSTCPDRPPGAGHASADVEGGCSGRRADARLSDVASLANHLNSPHLLLAARPADAADAKERSLLEACSSNAKRIEAVADAVLCSKCGINPRFASLPRCRACLAADTARELEGYERLRAAKSNQMVGGGKSNHQQAVASRDAARKPLASAPTAPVASKALTVSARSAQAVVPSVVAEPMRELGKPYTLAQWQTLITQTLRRWRAVGTVAQNRMAEQSLAAQTVAENVAYGRVTYGPDALITLRPPSNVATSAVHWALERMGVRFDLVDVFGDITDVRTICQFCDAKVRRPCNESRAQICANRSRGNR
jgi:hypothetical protein